jgi:hypothetical protein
MVLRQNPDADLPRQQGRGARKAEPSQRRLAKEYGSFDPADTHHARSMLRQIK